MSNNTRGEKRKGKGFSRGGEPHSISKTLSASPISRKKKTRVERLPEERRESVKESAGRNREGEA